MKADICGTSSRRGSSEEFSGSNVLGRESSSCKCLEVGTNFACMRNGQEANGAGVAREAGDSER